MNSLFFMQIFKFFYTSLFYYREVPLWVPQTGYGVPFDYYRVSALGPLQILTAGFGLLVKWRDVWSLFMTSLSLDMYFLALGFYLLAREAGVRHVIALAGAIAAIATAFPDIQLDFNLKIVIAVPISMYLVLRFVRTFDVRFAWACAAILLAFTYGTASYLVVVQFYVLAVWGVALLVTEQERPALSALPGKISTSALRPAALALLGLAVLAAIGFAQTFHLAFQEMQPLSGGRDQTSEAVPLSVFLTYGGNTDGYKLAEMVTGLPVAHDFRFFTGLVTLAFAVYAVWKCRNNSTVWPAFLAGVLALFFAMPQFTPVARLAFHLPGMNLVRHLGDMAGLAKPALFLLATIGLNSMTEHIDAEHRAALLRSFSAVMLVALFGAAIAGINLWGSFNHWPTSAIVLLYTGALFCGLVLVSALPSLSQAQTLFVLGAVVLSLVFVLLFPVFKIATVHPLRFQEPFKSSFPWVWAGSIVAATAVCAAVSWCRNSPTTLLMLILGAGAAEVGVYRGLILSTSPSFNLAYKRSPDLVEPLAWRDKRSDDLDIPIVRDVLSKLASESAVYGFRSTYLNIDGCHTHRQDMITRAVVDLRVARDTGHTLANAVLGPRGLSTYLDEVLPSNDQTFAHAMGCDWPKLQIVRDPIFASAEDAAAMIKAEPAAGSPNPAPLPIDLYPIIDGPAPASQETGSRIPAQSAQASIVEFSPDSLVVDVVNPNQSDAWLVYLDAFAPRWRAQIDGVATTIRHANLAFKAVLVPPGNHRVGFFLDEAKSRIAADSAVIGLGLCGMGFLAFVVWRSRRAQWRTQCGAGTEGVTL